MIAAVSLGSSVSAERASETCPSPTTTTDVAISGQRYVIPAGRDTYIEFEPTADYSRRTTVFSSRRSTGGYVFCNDELTQRGDAKHVRVGREVWISNSASPEIIEAHEKLSWIQFGLKGYSSSWIAPTPIDGIGSEIFVDMLDGSIYSGERLHITAGFIRPDIRVWSACNDALLDDLRVCRAGIVRNSDGMTIYTSSIILDEYPQAGQMPPSEILEIAFVLPDLLREFHATK
ncbi:hypothetical protein [Yoonia algicola]|uniref:Uncharacterized protein n=1 Tax=Yoonia algicola TaxID=3137368 RepID=A0AAN0LZY6_9RHOB